MAEIDNGGLHFTATMNNKDLIKFVDESVRRIQGLSDSTVSGGKAMDTAFNSTADNIRNALGDIGTAIGTHEQELQRLETEYQELGQKASKAFMAGRDDELRAITQQQNAVKGEITVRERLVKELQEQSNKLEDAASKMEENKRKAEENANAQVSMRTRIRALREEMMLLIDQGIDEQSEAYKRLEAELGRLTDIQLDVQQQGRMLANDEAQFQGIITGLSGLAGGFSAVTGAMSLFAGENEDLQKVMTKVQSVMAITMGMQQVAQTLNKDSAFQLVTLNGLKKWWRNIVVQATAAETAETVATTANTAAKTVNTAANNANTASEAANTVATGGQAAAATAGTVANLTLAGAFRAVGLAIKSIPVFGWIVTSISALIGLVSIFSSKAREARKAQEEFNATVVEGSYKSIGSVQNLSAQWTVLGNNLDAKKKFIEDNKKAFEELGVSIRDVTDAENLLVKNKDAFIDAQIAKAKAAAVLANSEKWVKQAVEADLELEKANKMPKVTRTVSGGQFGGNYSYEIDNPEIKKALDKQKEANDKLQILYADAAKYTSEGLNKMKEVGIEGQDKIIQGTVAWYEKMISDKQAYIKTLSVTDIALINDANKQIKEWQKIVDNATGKKDTTNSSARKDPFLDKLDKQKKEYQRFMKWVNSSDESIRKAAPVEFAETLQGGNTYLEYLNRLKEDTTLTKEQIHQINNEVVGETNKTMLDIENQFEEMYKEYALYLDKRVNETMKYENRIKLINEQLNLVEKDSVESRRLNNLKTLFKQLHDAQIDGINELNSINAESVERFGNFEQKKLSIVEKYEKQIRAARITNMEDIAKQFEGERDMEIMSLTSDYIVFFEHILGLSNDTAKEIHASLKSQLDALLAEGKITLEKYYDAVSEINNQLSTKTNSNNYDTFTNGGFQSVIQQYKDAGDAMSKAGATMNNEKMLQMGSNMSATAGKMQSTFSVIDRIVTQIHQSIQASQQMVEAIGELRASMGYEDDLSTFFGKWEQYGSVLAEFDSKAYSGFEKFKNGDMAGALADNVSAIVGIFTSLNRLSDKKKEEEIQKHAAAVQELQNAYNELAWEIDKALGADVYAAQKAAIENMRQQQQELYAAADAERSKKKADESKAAEYENQAKELDNAIKDTVGDMVNNIISTDAKSIADQLGDAFIEAFAKGEDAAKAWGDRVNDIVAKVVRNMLIQELLQKPIGQILDKYSDKWVDADGNFLGFDVVKNSLGGLGSELTSLSTGFADAFKDMPEDLKNIILGKTESDADTSLTGSYKTVSEETASMLGGQMNAIRINQLESTAVLRQQLFHLANIENNTSHLLDIRNDIRDIKNGSGGDSLRSQGLS